MVLFLKCPGLLESLTRGDHHYPRGELRRKDVRVLLKCLPHIKGQGKRWSVTLQSGVRDRTHLWAEGVCEGGTLPSMPYLSHPTVSSQLVDILHETGITLARVRIPCRI